MVKPTQRYACDRCHGQKLRCIHTERGPCVRCVKAKATCRWSQSLRSRRQYLDESSSIMGRQQERLFTQSLIMTMPDTPSKNQHSPVSAGTPLPNYSPSVFFNQLPSSNMATALDLDLLQTPFAPSPGVTQPGASARYPSPTLQGSGNYNYTRESGTDGSNAMPASTGWLGSADMYHNTQGALQVCWQQQFNQEWALLSSQAPVPLAGISTNPVNDVVRSNSKSPCLLTTMRQLSELNVELFAHETTVPKPPVSLSEPLSWKDKDFAIDRTFQLSQRLIEALNKQYPRYLETASVDVSKDSSSDVTQSSRAPVDQGFFLLILSCYTRLIEIYDRIFANMQACLDRSSVTDREDYVNLPSVKVGSFSLPDSSATQILLILQLSRHLLTRMSEVIEAIGVDKPNNKQDLTASECATGPGTLLVKSARTTVKLQEDGLMKRITQLRSTLLELNIL